MEEISFLNPSVVINNAGIQEGMRVADFGSGSGFFTRAAGRIVGPSGVVWAIDINPELLSRIKNLSHSEGLKNIEIMQGDITAEGGSHLPENSFDYVIVSNVLFQIDPKDTFLKESRRVLKPEGVIVLIDWTDSHDGLGPHKDHVLTKEEAKKLCDTCDLVTISEIEAGAYHWGLKVGKKQ